MEDSLRLHRLEQKVTDVTAQLEQLSGQVLKEFAALRHLVSATAQTQSPAAAAAETLHCTARGHHTGDGSQPRSDLHAEHRSTESQRVAHAPVHVEREPLWPSSYVETVRSLPFAERVALDFKLGYPVTSSIAGMGLAASSGPVAEAREGQDGEDGDGGDLSFSMRPLRTGADSSRPPDLGKVSSDALMSDNPSHSRWQASLAPGRNRGSTLPRVVSQAGSRAATEDTAEVFIAAAEAKHLQKKQQQLEREGSVLEAMVACGGGELESHHHNPFEFDGQLLKHLANPNERGDMLRAVFWDVLTPSSTFRTYWDFYILLLLCYISVTEPYVVCFGVITSKHLGFVIMDVITYSAFAVDIYLNFRTAVHDEQGKLVTDRAFICRQYGRGWFIIDLMATLPWEFLTTHLHALALIELLKLLRILKIVKMLRMLRVVKVLRLPYLLRQLESLIGRDMVRFFTLIGAAVLVTHLIACFFYYSAYTEGLGPRTWVGQAGLTDAPNSARYITAMYWAISTLTTVGYGDIVPGGSRERVMAMFGMLCGVTVFAYFAGTISALLAAFNQRQTRMAAKLHTVETVLQRKKVPAALGERVRNFYSYTLQRELLNDENSMLQELSGPLRTDFALFLYQDAVERVPFFAGKDAAFITAIITCLKTETFAPGDIVIRQGDVEGTMYFVGEGRLEVRLYRSRRQTRQTADLAGVAIHANAATSTLGAEAFGAFQSGGASEAPQASLLQQPPPPVLTRNPSVAAALASTTAASPRGRAAHLQNRSSFIHSLGVVHHVVKNPIQALKKPMEGVECLAHTLGHGAQVEMREAWRRLAGHGRHHDDYERLGEIGPGEYFGEYSGLLGDPRAASVIAVTYCELYSLGRDAVERVVKSHPEMAGELRMLCRAF